MSKQTKQYFIFFIIVLCFLYPIFSEAAELSDTKVLPITPNNYRKDPTELKKAVRKIFNTSNTPTNDTKSNAGFSTVKSTTSTPPIVANTKSDSTARASTSDSKTTAKSTSVSESKKNTSNDSSSKSKVVAQSPIKVSQPQKAKDEKTNNKTDKSKVVAQSSIKVSQPQKKLQEEKTSRKDRIAEPILKVKLGGTHTNVSVKFPDGGQINNSKGKRIKTLKKDDSFNWTSVIDKKSKSKKKIEYLILNQLKI